MKPMLAKKWAKGKISYPCYVQPKLNGLRGLYLGKGKLQSRSYGQEEELLWNPPVVEHILEVLDGIVWPLDGELYAHGWYLQDINSQVSVKRAEPGPRATQVEYHVFDVIAPVPFRDRLDMLYELKSVVRPPVHIVETVYCHSEEFSHSCYNHFKSQKYEGMMYRDADAIYGREFNCSNKENRWSCLLKRKERFDSTAECIGVIESDAETAIEVPHIGSLQLRWNGKVFSGGGGLTNAQKIEYYNNPPIGKLVDFTYESLSKKGIPLQTSTELVYE